MPLSGWARARSAAPGVANRARPTRDEPVVRAFPLWEQQITQNSVTAIARALFAAAPGASKRTARARAQAWPDRATCRGPPQSCELSTDSLPGARPAAERLTPSLSAGNAPGPLRACRPGTRPAHSEPVGRERAQLTPSRSAGNAPNSLRACRPGTRPAHSELVGRERARLTPSLSAGNAPNSLRACRPGTRPTHPEPVGRERAQATPSLSAAGAPASKGFGGPQPADPSLM